MPLLRTFFLAVLMAFASTHAQEEGKWKAIAYPLLQIGVGIGAGLGGLLIGAFIGGEIDKCEDEREQDIMFCGLGGIILGGGLGYSVGNVLGVSLVGKANYGKGYWSASSLGNLFGVAASFYLINQTPNLFGLTGESGMAAYAILLPALTTGGYHLGRYWDMQTGMRGEQVALQFSRHF